MLFVTTFLSAQQKTKLGRTNFGLLRNESGEVKQVLYEGYSAEILYVEFLKNKQAKVFMPYALYTDSIHFDCSIMIYDEETGDVKGKWVMETEKTGIISFTLKQTENEKLRFLVILNEIRYEESFSLSTKEK
jgi:hypothetical protein